MSMDQVALPTLKLFRHLTTNKKQTNKQNPWSRVLLEKPIVTQQVKKSLTFYGTEMLVTVFTRAGHWYQF
jgi:hypothetical protein